MEDLIENKNSNIKAGKVISKKNPNIANFQKEARIQQLGIGTT